MCYNVRQEDNLSRSSVNGRFLNWAAWLTGERSLRAVSSSGMKRTAAAGCWAMEREPGCVRWYTSWADWCQCQGPREASATPTHHSSLLTAPITAPGGWTSVGWAIPLRWQPSQSSVVFGPSARPHVYWCTALSPLPPSHSGWATLACSVRARAPCSCLETLVAARAELSHWQRVAPVVIALDRAQCELPVTFTILSDSRFLVCVKSPDSDWFVVTESVLWSGSSGYTWVLTVT